MAEKNNPAEKIYSYLSQLRWNLEIRADIYAGAYARCSRRAEKDGAPADCSHAPSVRENYLAAIAYIPRLEEISGAEVINFPLSLKDKAFLALSQPLQDISCYFLSREITSQTGKICSCQKHGSYYRVVE